MPNNTPKERTFQKAFVAGLVSNGYTVRSLHDFDANTCLDTEMFISYIKNAQSSIYSAAQRQYKDKTKEQLDDFIVSEYIKAVDELGLDHVLVHGFSIDSNNFHFHVTCPRPSSTANPELLGRYKKNTYSVIEEAYIDDEGNDRVDVLVFRNGVLYAMFELKYTKSGQNYRHAIKQWQKERDPKSRAMQANKGCLVYFAMDEDEVYFTTDVSVGFLPFNQGSNKNQNDIREIGAGNDLVLGTTYKTSYMFDDILAPATFDYIFDKLALSEVRPVPTFPRYHQYATVMAVDEMTEPLVVDPMASGMTFLTQQAPGAGKTLEISWAAIMLASKKALDESAVYDKVVIITDRIAAVKNVADELSGAGCLPTGFVKYAKEGSQSLLDAMRSSCRIVVSSSQKFLEGNKGRDIALYNARRGVRYAVFIDEAHDATEGKNQGDITDALLGIERAYGKITEIGDLDSQNRIDWFAFTATPKESTLQLFGHKATDGNYVPHTVYSMKQAIEEGFILDVLDNVYTIDTHHQAVKAIEDDPKYQSGKAKRALNRRGENDWKFIREVRIPAIVEHFRSDVDGKLLGGKEKALVACSSRENAVRYKMACDEYCAEQGYDIETCVAFSGHVSVDGEKKNENTMNPGIRGDVGEAFKRTDGEKVLRIMFAANKFQQAYDLPELCAGYICKHVGSSIALVQLYGRFNRVAFTDGEQKKTVIVDYANTWEEICEAHRPFYSTFGKQPQNAKDIEQAYDDVMSCGIVEALQLGQFAGYMDATNNPDLPEAAITAIQPMYDMPIDDAYSKYDVREDDEKKAIKKTLSEYRKVFAFTRIISPDEITRDELVLDGFLNPLLKKMSGRTECEEISIDEGQVEFVDHVQTVSDAVSNGLHIDGSDASMEAWMDAHTDELSTDPVAERDYNARAEEKEAKAQEERTEFLSVIVEDYNENNGDKPVEKSVISTVLDKVVYMLSVDDKLRQAALSNNIDDYRKQYLQRAKEISHGLPVQLMGTGDTKIEDVVFFMNLWENRKEDITRLMGFHCEGVFYKLRREAMR